MNALVMIAHGSRREEANAEFIALVRQVKRPSASTFGLVEHCFLELASPSLAEAVGHVIQSGATAVSVYPYFLNVGTHVLRDIPEMVDRLARQHPDCTIRILPYFGTCEGMAELIAAHIHGHS